MIKLYHGSNVIIERINLSLCKVGKDFGKGFYLNPNFSQAYEMAERTTRIIGVGPPIVNGFEFDDSLKDNCTDIKIKIFADYTEEWAEFVVKNRQNRSEKNIHPFDIVIGPIADDSVGVQIRRFIQGYLPITKLIEELRYYGDHAIQYYFGTELALKLLKRI